MTEKLARESPAMQEARQKFEKSVYHKKYGMRFDEIQRGLNRNYSYETMRTLLGTSLSLGTIGRMCERYFLGVIGEKSGFERRRKRQYASRKRAMAELEYRIPDDANVRLVAKRAREVGCNVEYLPRVHRSRIDPATKLIALNGLICSVQRKHSDKLYGAFNISRTAASSLDVHVLIAQSESKDGEEHIYLIPSAAIFRLRFEGNENQATSLRAPSPTQPGKCSRGKSCLRGYINAWWVVGQLTKPRAE